MLSTGTNGALRRLRTSFAAGLILLAGASVAAAQDYQAGLAAVDTGDMPLAVSIWQNIVDSDAPDRPQAEYALALLYETGRAVPWDEAKAAELYAASGLPEALTNLGLMYAEGRGVPFDPAKAAELWQVAADEGHSFASFNLGLAYYAGNGVPKNAVRALELIYDAGEGGLSEAQWAVCQFFERGVGVPVDTNQALDWCQRAAEQGHLQAIDTVQRLAAAGSEALQTSEPDLVPVPDTTPNPDDVDLSAQVVPEAPFDNDDATLEFATELPAVEPQDPDVGAADSGKKPESITNQTPLDPVLLLGSEFDEFADLLAPLDEEAETSGAPDLPILSMDADQIAALIDSAGNLEAELPELDIAEQQANTELREQAEDRGAPLSLQELVDGELTAAEDPNAPPMPSNRPVLTYAIPPVVEGPIYAVWLGTGDSPEEAREIYDDVMRIAPDILGIMEAAYQNDSLPLEQTGLSEDLDVVRLLFGPLPGQDYAWQICNLLKLKQKSTFCYPVEVEG